jgi:hypothetical protein
LGRPAERQPKPQYPLARAFLMEISNARHRKRVQRNHPGQLAIVYHRHPGETGVHHAKDYRAQRLVWVSYNRGPAECRREMRGDSPMP